MEATKDNVEKEKNESSISNENGEEPKKNAMLSVEEDGCPAHLHLMAKKPTSMELSSVVHLKKVEMTVGRSTESDLFLDSTVVPRMISRVHAILKTSEEKDEEGRLKWKISDPGSVNGFFVNDIKCSQHLLEDGDIITFGGGGTLALGTEKKQEDSEFVYQIRYRKPTLKRKSSGTLSSEIVEEEEAKKKQKLEEEEKELQRLKLEDEEKQKLEEKLKLMNETLLQKDKEMREFMERMEQKEKEMEEKQRNEMLKSEQHFQAELHKAQEQAKSFEEEKEKMIEENNKQTAELEQKRKEIEQKLEEKSQKMEELEKRKETIEEELTCVICQELILAALNLDCSHSFCGVCITTWMKKKRSCPYCNSPIVNNPVRSRTVDNTVAKLVETLPKEKKDEWEKRVKGQKVVANEQAQLIKILSLVKSAKENNLRFLDIRTLWSPEERSIFFKGLGDYTGKEARSVYCETTGLTLAYANTAHLQELKTAASNLGISMDNIETNTQELKRRLLRFIETSAMDHVPNNLPPAALQVNRNPVAPQVGVKQAQPPVKHAVPPVKQAYVGVKNAAAPLHHPLIKQAHPPVKQAYLARK